MTILGIGAWELLIILVIVLLVLGPDDLEKTGRTVGQWINKVTRSEGWRAVTIISRELRGLPARLAREAQLDELRDQIDVTKQIGSTPFDPGTPNIHPPAAEKPEKAGTGQTANKAPVVKTPDKKDTGKTK